MKMRYLGFVLLLFSSLQAQDTEVIKCNNVFKCLEEYLFSKHANFRAFNENRGDEKVVVWLKEREGTYYERLAQQVFEDWIFYQERICKHFCMSSEKIDLIRKYGITYAISKDNYLEWKTKLAEIEQKLTTINDKAFVIPWDFIIDYGEDIDAIIGKHAILFAGFKEALMPKIVVSVPFDTPYQTLYDIQNALEVYEVKVFFGGHPVDD